MSDHPHMKPIPVTDAEEKLCRDIAKAEGWELGGPENSGFGYLQTWWYGPDGQCAEGYPAYLTDPAEQCRMQEKIIEEYGAIHIYTELRGEYRDRKVIAVRTGNKKGEENTYTGKDVPHALAEAYLAMLEEKP